MIDPQSASTSLSWLATLFCAGAAGGALNAIAGGGSFVVFPALLLSGVPPVAANATSSVALWPAGLASAAAYRKELPARSALFASLGVASAIGGGAGALLLLRTPDTTFARMLPWLLLAASLIFTVGPHVVSRRGHTTNLPLALGVALQLATATYGGYFGGGMGIVMLAMFTLMGMTNIHTMNGLKVVLGVLINGVAVVLFVVADKVAVAGAVPVAAGAVVGGFGGAALARRVDPKHVRRLVLLVAWGMTAWFFVRGRT